MEKCSICGAPFPNQCTQGETTKHVYLEGSVLIFHKDQQEVSGRVTELAFGIRNHQAMYRLAISGGAVVTVAERNILRATETTPSTEEQ